MFSSETQIRVRYGETDRMGYVYYGNYAEYYEVGRVEALRKLDMNYRDLEDSGIMLPVYSMNVKYHKPAFYDDLLTIKTSIKTLPGVRLIFHYEVFNDKAELINEADTTLIFINKQTGKPCQAPGEFLEAVRKFF